MKKPTVLITGASSGFGETMAKKYHQNGHPVILIARRLQKLEAIKAGLNLEPAVYIAQVDITDKTQVMQFLNTLPEQFKDIGILINNAGLALGVASFEQAQMDDFETMIQTNITSLVYMTKHVLPSLQQAYQAHIINIGSIAGNWPYPGGNVYCASKAFVQQFLRTLRADLYGQNIRVTNIAPGLAQTEFSTVRLKGDDKTASAIYENKTPLQAHDIAEIVYFTTALPPHVNINTLEVMPTCQSWGPLPTASNHK